MTVLNHLFPTDGTFTAPCRTPGVAFIVHDWWRVSCPECRTLMPWWKRLSSLAWRWWKY